MTRMKCVDKVSKSGYRHALNKSSRYICPNIKKNYWVHIDSYSDKNSIDFNLKIN
jgi:hypothetical protein